MSDQSTPKSRKLLDQFRDAIRLKHYSYSTEKTYVHWAKRFILFHYKRHPAEMGATEIEAFLTHLAKDEVARLLSGMQGLHPLMAKLLYGCWLRLMECLRLRVKDIDFEQSQIIIREVKGEKDAPPCCRPAWCAPSRSKLPMCESSMNGM